MQAIVHIHIALKNDKIPYRKVGIKSPDMNKQ